MHRRHETQGSPFSARIPLYLPPGVYPYGAGLRGKKHTERQIATACRTLSPLGTQAEAVEEGLQALGYHCRWFEGATVDKLRELFANDWPVIIFLYAADLPHGRSGLHAVVLVEIAAQQVVLLDPMLKHTTKIDLKTFEIIWTNFGNQGMVIWP